MGTPTVALPTGGRASMRQNLVNNDRAVRTSYFTFTFSTTYATGGEAFDPAVTFAPHVRGSILAVEIPPKGGWTFEWDSAAKKIKAYVSGGTEVSAAANLSVTPGPLTVKVLSA